jgi:hypothetical protein
MKKLVSPATVFVTLAILGTALIGYADDDSAAQEKATDKPTVQRCPFNAGMQAPGQCRLCDPSNSDTCPCPLGNDGKCRRMCRMNEKADSDKTSVTTGMGMGPGMGMGRGMGPGRGMGMGPGRASDPQHDKDHQDFLFLLDHRDQIQRTVKNLPNGVETLTESDKPDVASMIQVHVEAMYDRLEHMNPIRMRDPIFRAVFANADKIKMEIEQTDQGVKVRETSEDEYVIKLVQEHAKVVSQWINNGYSELPKNHPAPAR